MKKRKKPLGYNKRSEEQRIYDIRFCSDLFLRGYSYREIADALNRDLSARGMGYTITFQMVYYDLQQCLIEWKRERLDNIDEYVTQELRKLDKMEQQAWEAWEASKTGKMRTKEKTNKGRPIKTDAEDADPEYYGYNETATETSASHQIAGERGAYIDTLATRRALVKIALRRTHLHVLGKLGVVLQCRKHQLPPMRERTATLCRRGAAHGVERALQLGNLVTVGLQLLRHRGQRRRRRVELGHRQTRRAGNLFHVLHALATGRLWGGDTLSVTIPLRTVSLPRGW